MISRSGIYWEGSMKALPSILAATVLIVAVSSSFSTAFAGFSRAAQMRGSDATYGSTGRCNAGNCAGKVKTNSTASPAHH